MYPPVEQVKKDGFDLQFGAHFLLTKFLLLRLIETAKSSPDGKARVMNTSSMGHTFVAGIDLDMIRDGPKRLNAGTAKELDSLSKFCAYLQGNVVFAHEFHRRYADQGIVSVSLRPGNLQTDLQRHIPKFEAILTKNLLYPAPMGALTELYAGTTPEGTNLGGKHLIPWDSVGEARKKHTLKKPAVLSCGSSLRTPLRAFSDAAS
ncbi:hypothetical protein BD311DRAFT_717067 [Dichomitus squalens]|uniref:NAD(P)-binding protein n=1 Tax=Dichomitus squalens TaxID=114155 RepID=A0A4Q9MTU5_9APHY|nr:hypothetical protein BD311DRAFT_717067 [Dichomitus squalens]